MQLPEDLVRVQEVITSLRPDLIVETGLKRGGSAIFFASLCRLLGQGRVISLDIDIPPAVSAAIAASPLGDLITLIQGNSVAPQLIAQVKAAVRPGEKVLVFLDSDHSKAHVLAELYAYGDLVTPGSYLVATDGVMRGLADTPQGRAEWVDDNPAAAARDFAAARDDFILDRPKARFRDDCQLEELTFWPDAWLRRLDRPAAAKMPNCILHYGMHKTGSSAIQESLFHHLDDPRYCYLGMGVANQSADLISLFEVDPLAHPIHRHHGTDAARLRLIQAQTGTLWRRDFRQAAGRTGLLSGEAMVTLSPLGLANLRDFVLEYAEQVRVVGYIRPPQAYMASAFQERLKLGPLDLDPDILFPRYEDIFAPFEAVFGRDRVAYWLYDPRTFPKGDVVQDFCARLGIAFPVTHTQPVNAGLALPAIKLLYAYRKFAKPALGANAMAADRRLVAALGRMPGPRLRLHPTLLAPALGRYQRHLDWMQARLSAPLAESATPAEPAAVRGEEDLLCFTPGERDWLLGELQIHGLVGVGTGLDPETLAEMVGQWRGCLAAAPQARAESAA